MSRVRVITAPAAYPVTLTEIKIWAGLDITDTSEDGKLTAIIAAMTAHAEHLTGRAFIERTLEYTADEFDNCIALPWAPLLGIDSVKYTDIADTEQTVAAADYEVDTYSEPGKVRPVWGEYWPSLGHGFNPVRIRYRAGYRPTGSPTDLTDNSYLPGQLRVWMQARITTLYDTREQLIVGASIAAIPRDYADGLLDSLILGDRLF